MLTDKKRRAVAPAYLAALCVASAASAGEFRYSEAPLRQAPLMSTAEVAVDLVRFNNWLNEKHASVPEERRPVIREHAYLLVDSILKTQRAEGRTQFNDFETGALTMMLSWATRFGVYGATLAAREVAGADAKITAIDPLLPPDPIELRLQFPSYFISSRAAPWRLQVPYYFMIWDARRFTAKNGLVTDLVSVSTSFAKHTHGDGKFQATLMFMYSPAKECRDFDRYWLGLLGIDAAGQSKEPLLPGATTYTGSDSEHHMRKEMTLSAREGGCTAFALLGIEGTFEANRVSYLDFLKSFNDASSTDPLKLAPPEVSRQCPAGQTPHEGGCIKNPVINKKIPPLYPDEARKKGIEGRVEIRAVVRTDGSVDKPVVLSCTSPGHGLEDAAIAAVKEWRYTPGLKDDRPVSVYITIVVNFELNRTETGG